MLLNAETLNHTSTNLICDQILSALHCGGSGDSCIDLTINGEKAKSVHDLPNDACINMNIYCPTNNNSECLLEFYGNGGIYLSV